MGKGKHWYSTKRATTVTEIDGMHACVYHDTAVVQWDTEKIILCSGGWESYTTKVRMNEVAHEYRLNFLVWQEKFKWFVRLPTLVLISCEEEAALKLLAQTDLGDGSPCAEPEFEVVPFEDGMEFVRPTFEERWSVR